MEVDDLALAQGAGEVDLLAVPAGGVEQVPEVALGEDREAVAPSRQVGLGTLGKLIDVGRDALGGLAAGPSGQGVEALGVHVAGEGEQGRGPEAGLAQGRQDELQLALDRQLVVGL